MATPRTPKPEAERETGPEAIEDAVVLPDPAPGETADAPAMPEPVLVEIEEPQPVTERAAAEPKAAAPQVPEPPQRSGAGSVIGMVFGGVIAAAAGFGLSQMVPQGWPIQADTALADRLAATEARLAELTTEMAELPAPLPPIAPDFSPVETRLDALAARLDAVEGAVKGAEAAIAALPSAAPVPDVAPRIDALEGRLAALESLPPGSVVAGGGDPAAMAALRGEIDALRAELLAADGPAQSALAEIAAATEAAKTALAEATAQAATLKAEAEAAAQAGRMQAALGRMRAALESGLPFVTAVADLQSGGAEVPAVLSAAAADGVATLAGLKDRFPEAARRALEDSLRADLGDSAVERLGSYLRTQVGARSLEPREGTDPDAVLSRAEAALSGGRLADALTELAGLPDPGKAAMADWTADAQQRLDAAAAVDAVAAALGEG